MVCFFKVTSLFNLLLLWFTSRCPPRPHALWKAIRSQEHIADLLVGDESEKKRGITGACSGWTNLPSCLLRSLVLLLGHHEVSSCPSPMPPWLHSANYWLKCESNKAISCFKYHVWDIFCICHSSWYFWGRMVGDEKTGLNIEKMSSHGGAVFPDPALTVYLFI